MNRSTIASLLSVSPMLGVHAAAAQEEPNALVWCDHTDPAFVEPFGQACDVKVSPYACYS